MYKISIPSKISSNKYHGHHQNIECHAHTANKEKIVCLLHLRLSLLHCDHMWISMLMITHIPQCALDTDLGHGTEIDTATLRDQNMLETE